SSIRARHALIVGMRQVDLVTLATSPTLAPPTSGRAVYGISVGGDIRLFTTFAEFSTELALTIGGGRPALALTASGSYDAATTTLHATHIAVHFAGN
ncbi:MAG TPA: hypothetical protein VM692_09490, partial [Gammaproteobacteria bacterium]|nr:hypothetical protein [Gammaproteobacteria bacterium]